MLFFICFSFNGCNINTLMDVDINWVISSDYQTITHINDVYISIDEFSYILCNYDIELLVQEAKVEGMPSFGKLFFGDRIYIIIDESLSDVLYLVTDYDGEHPSYFCKQSEYERIYQTLADMDNK